MERGESRPVAVSLHDVRVVLGGRAILDRVNAEIRAGELVVVLGPNGAGKSTLLRAILGQQPLAAGAITVDGRPVRRGSRRIGYVPQARNLDRDLPVRGADLVGLGYDGDRWGLPLFGQRRKQEQIITTIRAVGAGAFAGAPVGRLSGGEQQRLLLAQALLNGPSLLLLDEPLASLDLRHQEEMVQLIDRIRRQNGITVLLVTHDVNPLLPVLDRVFYVAGGRALLGTPADVIRADVLSDLYAAPIEVFRSHGRVFVASLGA